jgi:hypothetical protein
MCWFYVVANDLVGIGIGIGIVARQAFKIVGSNYSSDSEGTAGLLRQVAIEKIVVTL